MSLYRFPKPLLLRIALSIARAQPRSLGDDSAGGLRGASPPPVALNTHHLPATGPFVVVGNHYERPGLWGGWGAMVVSAEVRQATEPPRDLHWLMSSEMVDFHVRGVSVPRWLSRTVFTRFARLYGFGLVAPPEAGVAGGSGGLRVVARHLAAGEPLGVFPEGTPSVRLLDARPGVGVGLAWLTRGELPLVPVGIYERDDVLTIAFGPPFRLETGDDDRAERDRLLRDAVMRHVAAQLPPELRGRYG